MQDLREQPPLYSRIDHHSPFPNYRSTSPADGATGLTIQRTFYAELSMLSARWRYRTIYSKKVTRRAIIRAVSTISLNPRSNQLQKTRFKSGTHAPAQLRALTTLTRNIALRKASLFLEIHHFTFYASNIQQCVGMYYNVRKESPIVSLSWWGWGSCYESVVLGAPFTPAGITAEAERRVAHSISCDITL